MAGLRVFVSSTCVDLGAQRAQLRALLERMGYEPVMSDFSDVLYDHRLHTHTSCLKEVANVDMAILLIGSRFGGTIVPQALKDIDVEEISKLSGRSDTINKNTALSITQAEVIKAIEMEVPLYTFIDSKVHADHYLYQKNKDKDFADQITFPSIEKPETAKYIFEFINFITHRFSNNSITPYSSFSDIEDHLIKQWSLTFQRLIREERDKSVEGRRSDVLLENIQDLKAAVLQSMSSGSGREVARSVLKYRRLADFLLQMRLFNPDLDLSEFRGSFDNLLESFGVVDVFSASDGGHMSSRTIIILDDDTHLKSRIPHRRFTRFAVEWKGFSQLDKDAKSAVLDAIEENELTISPMLIHVNEPYRDSQSSKNEQMIDILTPDTEMLSGYWSNDRVEILKTLWAVGLPAEDIALALGSGATRNSVNSKAKRLGLYLKTDTPPENDA